MIHYSNSSIDSLIKALNDDANPSRRDESKRLLSIISAQRSHEVTSKQLERINEALAS